MYDTAPDGERFIQLKPVAEPVSDDERIFEGPIIIQNWFQELLERLPVD
jgi:hypothetical protein